VSLLVEIPEIPPTSMNLLSVELAKKSLSVEGETSLMSDMKQIEDAKNKILENDEVKIILDDDQGTFLPKQIYFKRIDQTIDLEMEFVRYPTIKSESGAYISAPRS